jgi:Tol biopolymer transport system component
MPAITIRTPFYFCTALLLCALSSNAIAAKTTRVSVASNGEEADGASYTPLIRADGRYVVFQSTAFNLIVGDNVNGGGYFIKDLLTKKTTRLGIPKAATNISINSDARYVTYILSNTGSIYDGNIFVYDRLAKKSTRVSTKPYGSAGGVFSNSYPSYPSISADGRYIAFTSVAALVAGVPSVNLNGYIYIYDNLTKKITLASLPSNGMPGDANNYGFISNISLSADGRFIVFSSQATNLVPGDTNSKEDVFVHDRATKKTTRVSIGKNGKQGNGDSDAPSISADGRFVTFISNATNLLGAFNGGNLSIFLADRVAQTIALISSPVAISQSISANGRYVALELGTNSFVYDRVARKMAVLNVDPKGGLTSGSDGHSPSISADGRYVAFASNAHDLVAGDTNNTQDIFVRDNFLNSKLRADLKITATKKPAILKPNSNGTYVYTISNSGPATVPAANLQYTMSGATPISYKASQGNCIGSLTIRRCNFGKLAVGKKVTLTVVVKAQTKAFNQQLSVSAAPVDVTPANNFLSVSTPVK